MMNFKSCVLTLVMLIASPAWAWEYVDTEIESRNQYFLNLETLRTDGNIKRTWQLINLAKADEYGWRSLRVRVEFDCKNETRQTLSYTAFSESFADGKVLFQNNTASAKTDIAPETVGWSLLQKVCKAPTR
jgi:hypothetical protein